MTKLTPKSEPHVHSFTKKVRFTEQTAGAHDIKAKGRNWQPRQARKFIGFQCDCKKVQVTDFESAE